MEKKDFCKVKQWKENINEKQFHISQVKRKSGKSTKNVILRKWEAK